MAKKSGDVRMRVSGGDTIDIDERGKLRNKDADEAGRSAKLKKKKKKPELKAHVPVTIEDNTYKVGQEKKKKKRSKEEEPEPKKKSKSTESKDLVLVSKDKAIKKTAKAKGKALAAIEEYAQLPPPVDEFDAEARRMFENTVSLAQRLEEQMEDRIYNRDVYALNTLYNQARELIADLRATRDIGAQTQELQSVVLEPYHRAVGAAIIDIIFQVEGSIRKHVKDVDRQAEIIKKLKDSAFEGANSLQSEFELAATRIGKVLQ